ncbi:hypothetical protein [Methylobacterium sp. P5_C11]
MSDIPSTVASWRDQIERLSQHASPCRYLLPAKWANALAFIDQFGVKAHRLSWTAELLFGVHAQHGFLRVEYAGTLMVNGSTVVAVDPNRIMIGLWHRPRRVVLRAGA